jgi:FkbM family methyltransferase
MSVLSSVSERLGLYRKMVQSLGVRGFFERSRANHFGNSYVHARWSANPVFVRRGTSDMWTFDLIFVDHEYRCIDHLANVRTIIDAGANVGYSSAYFLTQFPDVRVIAIEPDPDNFRALQRNVSRWGERVICVNAALWSKAGALSFRKETMQLGQEWGRQVESGVGDVQALDIPQILANYDINDIDLLKIDIEGAEKEVFAADTSWLDRVRNIVIELHDDEDRRVFHNAIRYRDFALSHCEELTVCLSQ